MATVPTGFCFVPQITGWMEMELSSSWAASPSSLKRFSGLPMAYPTLSTLQTISACLPASAWKSLPHEGPQGKSSLDRRLQMPRAVETYVPSLVPSCPWLTFSRPVHVLGLWSLPCPNLFLILCHMLGGPGRGGEHSSFFHVPSTPSPH